MPPLTRPGTQNIKPGTDECTRALESFDSAMEESWRSAVEKEILKSLIDEFRLEHEEALKRNP